MSSFTVPSGGYVATRLTVNNRWVDVHVGGSKSYVISPAYPEPTAPTVATDAVTGVEQTTATLNGYLNSLGTAGSVTVYFEWGTTTDYGNAIEVGSRDSGWQLQRYPGRPHSEYDLPLQGQGGRRRHQLWCRYDLHNTAVERTGAGQSPDCHSLLPRSGDCSV